MRIYELKCNFVWNCNAGFAYAGGNITMSVKMRNSTNVQIFKKC